MLTVFSWCSKNDSLAFIFLRRNPHCCIFMTCEKANRCATWDQHCLAGHSSQCWAILWGAASGHFQHCYTKSTCFEGWRRRSQEEEKSLNCVQQMLFQKEKFTDFISANLWRIDELQSSAFSRSEWGGWGTHEAMPHIFIMYPPLGLNVSVKHTQSGFEWSALELFQAQYVRAT